MNKFHTEGNKKRISLLLSLIMILTLAFSGNSIKSVQAEENNLVAGGNFETWADGKPVGWSGSFDKAAKSETKHDGSFGMVVDTSKGTSKLYTLVKGIKGGKTYRVSFWYDDSTDGAKIRPWMSWKKNNGNSYAGPKVDDNKNPLKNLNQYLKNSSGWKKWEAKVEAPVDAEFIRFEVRTYKEGNGGKVYFDDFSVVEVESSEDTEKKLDQVKSNVETPKVFKGTEVELSTTTSAAIYYTIGEKALTTTQGAIKYEAPIVINEDTEIHTVAVAEGYENSDEAVFNYVVIPDMDLSTIADAKELEMYTIVKARGIITGKIGSSIFVQDNTDGIYVYTKGSEFKNFQIGNEIEIVAKKNYYGGVDQLSYIQAVKLISKGNPLPEAIEVNAENLGNEHMGKLVTLKNVFIRGFSTSRKESVKNNYSIWTSNGVVNIAARVDKNLDNDIPIMNFEEDMYVEVTAPVTKYYSDYQLMLSNATDVKILPLPSAEEMKIYDIQGEAHKSPASGKYVETIGVVTGISTYSYDPGVFIQDLNGDGNDRTSDGIFVRGKGITAVVGDKVKVKGFVSEVCKYPAKIYSDEGQLSITEIRKTSVEVLESNVQLPTPVVLGEGGRALITDIVNNDNFAYDPEEDAMDLYESVEGMLVQINNPRIVGVQERYGTFDVLADNGKASEGKLNARGGIKITKENINPEVLHVDDVIVPVSSKDKVFIDQRFNMAKVGDSFSDSIVGIMDYGFGAYKIFNTAALPDVTPGSNERETTTITFDEEKLTVAVYNIENFAATEKQTPTEKVERIAHSMINELGTPDIISVVEVQDNNGPEKGDSDASKSYERLIDAIVEAGGPRYAYTDIAPVDGKDGGQPNGNIRVGFIYRPDRVEFKGTKGGQTEAATMNGEHLAKNPSRIDPTNKYFESTRKSLVGEFIFREESVFVISNHFNSKRGDTPDFGSEYPVVKGSEPKRHKQAEAVNKFVKEILEAKADAKIVVLGDMNDYEYSETLNILKGSELTNMFDTLPVNERYSYVYGGNLQVLDNMLVSNSMVEDTVMDVVHVNAEFTEHSGRASDHDPVMIQISNIGSEDYSPVMVKNITLGSLKLNDEGVMVNETKNTFRKGETITIKSELKALNPEDALIIVKVLGPENNIHMMTFDSEHIENVNDQLFEHTIATSLPNAKSGNYRVQVYVWRSLESQEAISRVKQATFTIIE